jgi:hypothetical protein
MEREDNMKKKIKKFAEGGYQGREGQKALNLDELSSLNLETGTQTPQAYLKNPKLYHSLDQIEKGTAKFDSGYMPPFFGTLMKKMNFGAGSDMMKKGGEVIAKKMKKGGKVKAKRKPIDGRMKKAKCRDGIAQRGKTRGKIR